MTMAASAGLLIASILVVMLVLGFPIAIALGVSSLTALATIMPLDMTIIVGTQQIFSGISIFTLIAIPFFILAGNIMNKGGIALRLINLAKLLTGSLPGAMAHTNAVSNMLFGAISGSGVAAASAMGTIIGPIAEKDGYDRDYCATINIATAPTGLLIPPSNVLITYSLVSGASVAALFMAGYIPGILWGSSCMLVAYLLARKKNYRSVVRFTRTDKIRVCLASVPSLLLIIIVIGGIIGGVFTPTEGSVVAVVYSLFLGFCYKSITLRDLPKVFRESAMMTGIICFLIGVSAAMAFVMAFTRIPEAISGTLLAITSNPTAIFLIINAILLFAGTFMDITPAILIFTPIFWPICQQLGMTVVHFGIMLTYNLCIGTITPPVGNILFVGIKVGRTTLERVFRQLFLYYFAIAGVLLLVTFVPKLSTWLPSLLGYSV